MYKLLNNKFKLFLLVNIPIWIMLTINGWVFVPIVVVLAWFLGGFIDGIKEDPIEFSLENEWSRIWLKNRYVKFAYKGETYYSAKRYNQLCENPEDYDLDYNVMRTFRRWQYDEVRAPIFKHKNLWWGRVHLVFLMAVICVVHFFNLPWYFIFILESSFLQCEVGYYLYTAKYFKRFFPNSYNLWGDDETKVITEKRLYIILSVINVVYLVLSYII